jgi:nickel transport protein
MNGVKMNRTDIHGFVCARSITVLIVLFLSCPATVFAHKLNVFATAQGTTIEGHVYFPGDIPARNTVVIVRDPSGHELDRMEPDAQGKFKFIARSRIDHIITAELADGSHGGKYTVRASELPDSLSGGSSAPPKDAVPEASAAAKDTAVGSDSIASPGNDLSSLNAQVAALGRQLESLRQQLDQSEQQTRFRDILGGIGYILGLAGIGLYLKARRPRE